MDEHEIDGREARLRATARSYAYPPTPDIARAVAGRLTRQPQSRLRPGRRLAWGAALALVVILAAMLAVPSVRAAVIDFIQAGAIRIFFNRPQTPAPPLNITPSLLDLAGETTFTEAQGQVDFLIRLPGYPADLGLPDRVFVQRMRGPVVVLVWTVPEQPEQIRLSLMLLGEGALASKEAPPILERTTVNGADALWMSGSHLLFFNLEGRSDPTLFTVQGNVLVWEEGGVTYRIESNYSLEEVLRIAGSLR